MGTNRQVTRVWRWLGRYGRDRRGNISTLVALLIVPLVGVMGIATETGNWFLMQRSMQNAADSAVLAAATNATGTQPVANQTYVQEGRAVASNFGYTNGANSTTVTIVANDNTVPAKCASLCYAATITRTVPVYLNRIIGWSATQSITAKAVAVPQNVPTDYCLVSLAGPGNDGYHIDGGPSVDLTGCNVLSNGDTTCNGANSSGKANSITYIGTNKNGNCAPSVSSSTPLPDPYSAQAANLPDASSCSSPGNYTYTSAPIDATGTVTGKNGVTYPGVVICGNVTINGNVTVLTSAPGSVLVIENGTLTLASGATLSSSGNLTLAFTGTSGGLSSSMTGTLDFSSPTTGTWQGFSMYQDPTLPITSSIAAGGGVVWKVSGINYLPRTNLQFNGSVTQATNGLDCFVLVDYTFKANGTGSILEHQTQCTQQGVTLPSLDTFKRAALVY